MTDTASGLRAITRRHTPEEVRQIVSQLYRDESDPTSIFEEIIESIIPQYLHGTRDQRERARYMLLNKSDAVAMAVGLDHHVPLLDTIDRKYAPLLLSITQQIEREYDCTTAAEKMLAEQAAMAHLKVIDHSRRLNDTIEFMRHTSKKEAAQQVEALSRQVDRATRQLCTALAMLRQFKQPQLAVSIRNTYVAKNQQINATPPKS